MEHDNNTFQETREKKEGQMLLGSWLFSGFSMICNEWNLQETDLIDHENSELIAGSSILRVSCIINILSRLTES